MTYSVSQAKNDLSGILHGTTNNQITNIDGLFWRAARQVLLDCDPQETKRIIPFTSTIFNSVYDYACPDDLKGNRVLDIRPQVNRQTTDQFSQYYNERFDVTKLTTQLETFTINFNTAVKTIRLNAVNLPAPTIINNADSLTSNGTWAATTSASNLAVDNVNFVSDSASLSFDLAASGSTGYLENSTMTQLDLTSFLNQGSLFLYTYLPTASSFTNVILRWGSDASNYYQVTATTTQAGTVFQNGWNLLKFTWLGATVVGTPDVTKIDTVRVIWTYDGTAQTSVRLNQIFISLGTILEIEYYSKFLFRTSAGVFQETVTDDSNLINLDTESYNLLLYKVCEYAVQQQQGLDALFYDGNYFNNLYQQTLTQYNQMYPSEAIKPQNAYYGMKKPTWRPARRGW